jgi:hypothetical protein
VTAGPATRYMDELATLLLLWADELAREPVDVVRHDVPFIAIALRNAADGFDPPTQRVDRDLPEIAKTLLVEWIKSTLKTTVEDFAKDGLSAARAAQSLAAFLREAAHALETTAAVE